MIQKIGIIGAGQMGNGIAHVLAAGGYDIMLTDTSNAQMQKAMKVIEGNMGRQVSRGKLEQVEMAEALGRITTVAGLPELADADLVIEAASEDEDIKRQILTDLGPILKPEGMIATNTSSISITRLAAVSGRPEKFMGMHFMNPVPVMELVELIRGIGTDAPTFDAVRDIVIKIGKIPTNSEDFPAFIVNRILVPMINEAIYTLYEGVGTVEGIDSAMRLGANHRMGPLQLADFIGLDTCLAIMQVLYEGLADTKYRPCPLLVKYVEAGWLGRKAGRGFYDYQGEKPVPTR
ncbi:MAG: 3-hydroxybutyryl-CoA dehydrogenase [Rhodospirillaceae bacterium]|jgi:3-hydroxybutyryl-CoA dehydrogenase|nr:3-hydroxybutyryl-CoA dehydrogenase [Rhodospirillaceae bacterium]MBT3494539.1 3-hydroxybutyryl-CoA dehydrogenase [Rhodospirillaceae bacterium]MBT3778395.1 3-hydroxybutyryl-CoA dehydrogenase [Rhodospirillaceae bacterium]MBT3974845.1 3-hydroxybutyryl-CoA dehydrogenase [Rhodospirillaceae bacterium]MBT4169162.1 3-hydroxybutyryl-CoA dehydrogenase [Rhodospirillaceae bacterium]